jgi:hypothetical protein
MDYEDDGDYEDYRTEQQREDEDVYIESRGGIDKCMNCGRYKFNDELNYDPQVCKIPCRNPREY